MKIGIFGFPVVGKTTLFNILSGAKVDTKKHTFSGKTEIHIGVAKVHDERLERLSSIVQPKKTTFATLEFLDMGYLKREEKVEELLLNEIKNVYGLIHVVRAFKDETIPHSQGQIAPAKDIETMETELILSDSTIAEKRIQKLKSSIKKSQREEEIKELELIEKCFESLQKELPLRQIEFPFEEEKKLRGFTFLSQKPILHVINMDEKDISRMKDFTSLYQLQDLKPRPRTAMIACSAKIESELSELSEEDAAVFKKDLGIEDCCTDRIIAALLKVLDMITFFTIVGDETRAWLVKNGTTALHAAGSVHTDMARGFIKAEVAHFNELLDLGSFQALKEKGQLKLEGKEYTVQDGDIINFRFQH
jgi:GTP-binding protein YchF